VAAAAGAGLAVVAGTVVLGIAAGYAWVALAARPALVMTGPGSAFVANAESNANFTADVTFCLVCLVGGVLSGIVGYLLAVRRHGPLAMAGVLAGAVAAAFLARWIGQQSGLAEYRHLLATLPAGASLRGNLTLSSGSALACWPLAACAAASALEMLAGWRHDLAAGRALDSGAAARQAPPA
jgi:hypothetical protein